MKFLKNVWAAIQILLNYQTIIKEVQEAIAKYQDAMADGTMTKEEAIAVAEEALDVVYLVIPALKDLIGVFKRK